MLSQNWGLLQIILRPKMHYEADSKKGTRKAIRGTAWNLPLEFQVHSLHVDLVLQSGHPRADQSQLGARKGREVLSESRGLFSMAAIWIGLVGLLLSLARVMSHGLGGVIKWPKKLRGFWFLVGALYRGCTGRFCKTLWWPST